VRRDLKEKMDYLDRKAPRGTQVLRVLEAKKASTELMAKMEKTALLEFRDQKVKLDCKEEMAPRGCVEKRD
jgi:hypothetical protein